MSRYITIGRYMGGKASLVASLLPFFPDCQTLVSPCGGFYSVELNYPHPRSRVYFDLNPRTVNLLRCIRDDCDRLVGCINVPPAARTKEFLQSCFDAPRRAYGTRALNPDFVNLFDAAAYYWVAQTSYRGAGTRWYSGITTNGVKKARSIDASYLKLVSARLQGVQIELGDGLAAAAQYDADETLFYIDPTYENSVRGAKDRRAKDAAKAMTRNQYAFETDQQQLVETALSLRGTVIVSGYPNPLYDKAFQGWITKDFEAGDTARNRRTERIWLNQQCWAALRWKGLTLATQMELMQG